MHEVWENGANKILRIYFVEIQTQCIEVNLGAMM